MSLSPVLSLALLLLLAACAQQPVKEQAASAPAAKAAEKKAEPKGPPLPNRELTEELLFQYLLAEVAAQRGSLPIAAGTYLELAKNTRDPRIAQRATELALQSRLLTTALETAGLWLELDPASVRARQTLAALLVNTNKLDEARPHLEKLLAAEQENVGQGFLQLNGLLARHNDKAAVLKLVRELAKPFPRLAEAHVAMAQAAWYAGDLDAAIADVKEARALRPDWEMAVLFQVQILQRKGLNAQGLEELRGYLSRYPKSREARLAFARALVAEKDYTRARGEFQQLLADFPGTPEVMVAVGLLSLQLKDYGIAETQFRKVLETNYRDLDTVRLYLGQVFEEQKRYEEAGEWYKSVVRGEQFLQAQIKYAAMLARQGRLADGRRHLQELDAQNLQQRSQLAMAEAQLLRDSGSYQEAFDVLTRALEKQPNTPDLLYDQAMAAEKLERLDLLESNLRKVIQLKPDHAHAYNALGYTLADRNQRLQEARQLIEKALALAPEDPFIMDSMGWVLYRLGSINEGLDFLRRAFAHRPDPEIAAHLGEVLWMKGERDEAKRIWQSNLKDNPTNQLLLNTIKRFTAEAAR
ncbi:MAG: tetratricopeptide repeat protein [Betaproteobacteria bacterium]|nr:tetratricopeptide repeat protein [Betaproteobacteria bacterium]